MSRFIVSRTENGVSFCLLAQNGRRLVTSRTYATLDACKKGIASLIANAPNVPLVDSSAGEYGKNPKFEVVQDGEGFGFLLKSANGKSVIVSSSYACGVHAAQGRAFRRRAVPAKGGSGARDYDRASGGGRRCRGRAEASTPVSPLSFGGARRAARDGER